MQTSAKGSRNLVGIILVTLGVIFLLDTLDVFGNDTSLAGDFWPLLIIAVGFVGWSQRGFSFELGPMLVIAVGALLLAGNLTDGDVWQFWPILLIIVGLWLVFRRRVPMRSSKGTTLTGDGTINSTAVFGGNEQRVTGEFRGGRVTALMGDGKLNLMDATLPPDGAALDVSAIMSGYDVMVPATWKVVLNVDAFLGTAEDKRRGSGPTAEGQPALEIRGSVIMGSIEVKS